VNILCKGSNQPGSGFSNWLGKILAKRNKNVDLNKTARISPGALINPRAGKINIGAECLIAPGAQVQGNVSIGNNSSVQPYSIIVGYGEPDAEQGQIKIGTGVRIAAHCMIIAGNHCFENTSVPIHEQGVDPGNITIEDNVWIGGTVNILAGVTIGHGSVIGAGSVVTKDIQPMSIAVGAPAKVIKQRK
jgi:acetyltransferase-like isoleucine patch superfamily enzyme